MKDLEKKVAAIVAEDIVSPDLFTSSAITPIRDSLNDAIQEVCMLTGSYTRTYHVNTQENQYVYDIEMNRDHFGYVLQAWNRSMDWQLERTDVKSMMIADPGWFDGGTSGRTGNQYKYFQVGYSQVGFWYIPSSSGLVIELKVMAVPQAYTDDDDPIRMRGQWEDAIVNYAASEQFASRGDSNRATEYYTAYLEGMGVIDMHPEHADRMYTMGDHGSRPWLQRFRTR